MSNLGKQELSALANELDVFLDGCSKKFYEISNNKKKKLVTVNPTDDGNLPFLSVFKVIAKVDCAKGGVVIKPIGFGSREHEPPIMEKMVLHCAIKLEESGFQNPEIIPVEDCDPIIGHGYFIFVPLVK